MADIQGLIQRVNQHINLYADAYYSGMKTAVAMLMSYGTVCIALKLARQAALISTIFGLQVIIIFGGIMFLIWKHFKKHVTSTLIRIVESSSTYSIYFWREFLSLDSNGNDINLDPRYSKRVANRKIVRMLVMSVMMRHCIVPDLPIYVLLLYVFYVTNCDYLKFSRMEVFDFMACLPVISEFVPLEETSSVQNRDQTNHGIQESNSESTLQDIIDEKDEKSFRQKTVDYLKKYSYALVTMVKIVIAILWVVVLLQYSKLFTFCINVYISVTQSWLEQELISILLSIEIDGGLLAQCEGLEQYYIAGGLALVELYITLTFMIWILEQGKPLIMLVALYTNIYCTGYDIYQFIITPAAHERAFLGKFEKLSGADMGEGEDVCPICLGHMGIARKTTCGHVFHGHCLRKMMFHGRQQCPMCRASLS